MTTLREAAKKALEALELLSRLPTDAALDYASNAIDALRERLAQIEPTQVSPATFVELVEGMETMAGHPAYWAEWPNREQP